jgi:SAM-dependent methyltransferase
VTVSEGEGSQPAQPVQPPLPPPTAPLDALPLRARVHAAARTAWVRLRGGELTPARAAASVAVGLAVGVTPLYGVHFWIVVAICLPLRLDAALAYLAANISLPFVAPFILLGEVELGSLARTGHALALTASEAKARAFGELAKEVAVGTLLLAPMAAFVGGSVTWGIAARAARAKRKGMTPFEAAVERVAARYAKGRRAAYHYVRGKLASDPVAARILALGALGDVVDVGCGRGQLAVLLLEARNATRVTGFDWDTAKVGDAREAATGLDATFDAGDMRTVTVPPCDTVLFVDVLHYLTDGEQDAVLAHAADAARTRVVVRELDPARGWRSGVTRVQERITTSLGYNRGARVNVRAMEELTAPLRDRGFTVRIEPCWGATPFSNVVLIAERPPRA